MPAVSEGGDKAPAKAADVAKTAAPKKADATDAKPEETGKHQPTSAKPETPKGADAAKTSAPGATASADTSPRSAPPAATRRQPQRSVFWPLFLGGILAGAVGFAASEMNVFNTRVETAEISEMIAAQGDRIAALESAEPAAPQTVEMPNLSGIDANLAALSESVSGIEMRLTELEARPSVPGDASTGPAQDYSAELAALQSSIEAQRAEIERLIANAQSVEEATANAARQAALQSALTNITAALNTGSGYAPALDDLSANGVGQVPDALAAPANDGVPTLLRLQTEFPDNARAALAAARAAGADGETDGIGTFLRRQLGARSVQPREGSDPDAVLSRAEAAVRDGRIADALAEIETLPAEAQAAMESWLADARARADAEAAVQDLSQRLTAN
ncbi:hypothetical protein AB2B41_12815 [Marimonas sp. MJW-29]|uniref:Inner membrane protein n=1 Tax=Sulfitobacter sediminis TaxID=3234186 RepID=A0ABV3RNL2_9RHOB